MIALAAVLAAALAGAVAAITWLAYRAVSGADRQVAAGDGAADARVAQVATEAELERVQFELETTKQALGRAAARAAALEEEMFRAHPPPNTDLAPDDVRERVRRLAATWGAAEAADRGGAVPAEPGGAVSPPPAAEPAGTAAVPEDGAVR